MAPTPSHLHLALDSIEIFKDGKIDLDELKRLRTQAFADNKIDDQERRVLKDIFSRINEDNHNAEELAAIEEFKTELGI